MLLLGLDRRVQVDLDLFRFEPEVQLVVAVLELDHFLLREDLQDGLERLGRHARARLDFLVRERVRRVELEEDARLVRRSDEHILLRRVQSAEPAVEESRGFSRQRKRKKKEEEKKKR